MAVIAPWRQRSRRTLRARYRTYALNFLFVFPALVGLTVFQVVPLLGALRDSLYQYSILGQAPRVFVGLGNYTQAFQDSLFVNAVKNTAIMAFCQVTIQIALALGLALLVRRKTKVKQIIRTVYFLPVVTSGVVISVLWQLMYDPSYGFLNSIFSSIGLPRLGWYTNQQQALPAIIIVLIWGGVGFFTLVLLAGLQGIDPTYYEAGVIDGAGAWALFRYITLPLLKRTLTFCVVIATIFSCQTFTPVFVITQGGPAHATDSIVYFIYNTAFINLDMGYANSLSIILLGILLVVSIVQLRLLRSQD